MQRSFDHLIGAVEQRRWHLQPDRLCRPQIDDELEFVRLLDRDVGGLGAAQYLDDLAGELPENLGEAGAIGGEADLFRGLGPLVDRGKAKSSAPAQYDLSVGVEET